MAHQDVAVYPTLRLQVRQAGADVPEVLGVRGRADLLAGRGGGLGVSRVRREAVVEGCEAADGWQGGRGQEGVYGWEEVVVGVGRVAPGTAVDEAWTLLARVSWMRVH